MKFNKWYLSLVAICAAFLTGCATPSATQQQLIMSAAAAGTIYEVQNSPSSRRDFIIGESVLTTIATGTNQIDYPAIQAALAQAGETNAIATLGMVTVVNLCDSYVQSAGTSTNAQTAALRTTCGWVATGIGEGLALTPAK